VARWLGRRAGVGWEEEGELLGAAWARRLDPVIAYDEVTGEPLPEAIVSVVGRGAERASGVS
jgi:hypothetical protein